MTKKTVKINAKQFIEDVAAGRTDEELMRLHGLDRAKLDKLKSIPEVKKRIESSAPAPLPSDSPVSAKEPPATTLAETLEEDADPDRSVCSQCGAEVSDKALICPECGHVLTGRERWARVDTKKTLLERVPPLVQGAILAIPVAMVLFILFRFLVFPAQFAIMEKKMDEAKAARTEQGKQSEGHAGRAENDRLQETLIDLQDRGLILEWDGNKFSRFKVGHRWLRVSEDERERALELLCSALTAADHRTGFKLVQRDGNAFTEYQEHDVFEMTEREAARSTPEGPQAGEPIQLDQPVPEEETAGRKDAQPETEGEAAPKEPEPENAG
ncbi:MAG: zinc-ribbon domain-containing protein [Pseudomonadota bacterium]